MNEKENIDYILLNILKYYEKSGYNELLLTFENTPCDRLLFEIVRKNRDKFKGSIYIECSLSSFENLFQTILNEKEREDFTFSNLDDIDIRLNLNQFAKTRYRICGKNELVCKSYLKYDYDKNDAYPLYGYTDEEIESMLKFLQISIDDLEKEGYGLDSFNLELLKQYLYNYRTFVEENDKEKISEFLSYIRRQRNLITKFIIPLKEIQDLENII